VDYLSSPDEIKASAEAGTWTGYGAVFDNLDDGRDIIKQGAFKKIRLKKNNRLRVPLYHDMQRLVGDAEVTQDSKGLLVKGKLNMALPAAEEAYQLLLDGGIDSMSVGFNILPKGSEWDEGYSQRTITKAELWEVSLVPFGMNRKAKLTSVKSIIDDIHEIENPRALERLLRHVGFSRKQSVAIAAGGFKALAGDLPAPPDQSDSGADLSEMLSFMKHELAN
jgi:HK97 family phage prohead protease